MAQIGEISQKVIQHGPFQIAFQVIFDLLSPVLLAKIKAKRKITYENTDSVKE